MSSQENAYRADESQATQSAAKATARGLRWWPAVAILLLMAGLKSIPLFMESPPLPVLMLSFMGPGLLALLIPIWWLTASRAPWRERLLGFAGLLIISVVAIAFVHISIRGMGNLLYQIPIGLAAFALPLILLAAVPAVRVPAALLAALIGFGTWDLLKMLGTTGKFEAELAWRWSPTDEDRYVESLADRADVEVSQPAEGILVSRATAEWSDFRGPLRDGAVEGITLDSDWQSSPPLLVWKQLIGPGWSSFSSAAGMLFTQEQRLENEAVVCLDMETGKVIWEYVYPGRFWEAIGGAGPRATPTIGENRLFALGADGHLAAIDPADGTELWTRSFRDDAQREAPTWGWSASPLLVGSTVIVHAGGSEKLGVLAYSADDGELLWSVPSGDHSYSSPELATFDGVEGVLMMTNTGLQFLNAQDGSTIWVHDWKIDNYRAIQPLVLGNSVLIGTSLGGGTRRIEVSRESGDWKTEIAWTSMSMKPDFNDYVAFGDHLYGFDGNIFACISLQDGKREWKRGRYGNGQVLLLRDSGQLLVITEDGELVLLNANPEKLDEVARFQALDGKTWNHPIVIDGRIYLRNGKEVACYELPTAK